MLVASPTTAVRPESMPLAAATTPLQIRPDEPSDWPGVWTLLEPAFRAGEISPQALAITEAAARRLERQVVAELAEARRIWAIVTRGCIVNGKPVEFIVMTRYGKKVVRSDFYGVVTVLDMNVI